MDSGKQKRIVFPLKLGTAAAILFFTVMVMIKTFLPGGITRFAGFGETFEHRYISEIHEMGAYIKPESGGYDGQFYAQIATDPTLRNPEFNDAIDEPAYRARRILLPAFAHLLAFGDAKRSILIYSGLNILFWYLFAWVIWIHLGVSNAREWAKWLVCVFSMGVMDSVKYSLMDLPSMLMILLMIRYATCHKVPVAGGFMASLFLKETNLLAIVSLPNLKEFPTKWLRSALYWAFTASLSLALFYSWYRHVNARFGTFHGVSGNFDWPFVSLIKNGWLAVMELFSGNFDDRFLFRILAIVGFIIQLCFLLTRFRDYKSPLVRLGWVYAFLFIFLGDLVWWGYWAVCRVALPMTIAFNLLYTAKSPKWFWAGLIAANLTVIHSLYRIW